ncbi:MAG: DUF2065 domain-containing protein [Gammaproteobacteria bacterium RBG_16_57_12]|nr:MAG: DUF2065 domain-containing protein [Gammaproteobacteria bacterium RBG_16_57_12]
MLHDLLNALALVLVIEGILPFANPAGMRKAWLAMAQLDDRALRVAGLLSMLTGVALLYLFR